MKQQMLVSNQAVAYNITYTGFQIDGFQKPYQLLQVSQYQALNTIRLLTRIGVYKLIADELSKLPYLVCVSLLVDAIRNTVDVTRSDPVMLLHLEPIDAVVISLKMPNIQVTQYNVHPQTHISTYEYDPATRLLHRRV